MIRLNRPPRFGVRTLGFGNRAAIWLQGCTLACPGCASRDTWDPDGGEVVAVEALVDRIVEHAADLDGLTISGGEPLQQAGPLLDLVTAVRERHGRRDVDVLCFTGYTLAVARRRAPALVDALDVVVDGRFRVDEPTALPLRGSANQRVHLLTELAATRYGDLDAQPRPPLQFELTDAGIELIGIPLPGELDRLEAVMADGGLVVEGASWR